MWGSGPKVSADRGSIAAGRDIIIRIGATAAASTFAGQIQAFLEEYLIVEKEPGKEALVPFGGRDPELERLDSWLDGEKAPVRFLLAAPAGRGKSALLVHWIKRLEEVGCLGEGNDQWRLAFMPISLRFETNRPTVFYEALAAQLAEIVGQHLEPPHLEPAPHYENQCRILLNEAIKRNLRVLLVIDGIDEALGESFGTSWFPRIPGPHMRLLVSARLQVGDRDAQDWIARLGWATGVRVQSLDLPPLVQPGIEDLLRQAGAPVDVLAARPEITQRLLDLTGGEPLLLWLYVEDLWKRGDAAGRLTLDDLARIKPGFGSYFEDWFERQHKAWVHEGAQIDKNVLNAHLAVLACAYGRLTADELAELAQRAHGIAPSLNTEDVLHPIRRFIIGTGRRSQDLGAGYVLSHPKLGVFLREEYFPDSRTIERTRDAFTAWGREVVQNLNQGLLKPEAASPYLLQYLSQHFTDSRRAGCAPGRASKAAIAGSRRTSAEQRMLSRGHPSGLGRAGRGGYAASLC